MKASRLLPRLLIAAVIITAAVSFFAFDLSHYLNLETLKAQQHALQAWRSAHPWWLAAVFLVGYIAIAAASLPGAALATIAAGAVFGLARRHRAGRRSPRSIGATLAFLASRFLLRDAVQRRFGKRLETIDEGMQREGAFYLFTLRLVPALPFFVINLVMGLTALPVRTFYWVSQVGMLAGTVVYVNAGTQLAQLDSASGIFSPVLLGSFVLLGHLSAGWHAAWSRWLRRRTLYARWKKPKHFDRNLVVIGAGAAGLVSAYIAATVKSRSPWSKRVRWAATASTRLRAVEGVDPQRTAGGAGRASAAACRDRGGRRATVDFAAVMAHVQRGDRRPSRRTTRWSATASSAWTCVKATPRIVSPWEVALTMKASPPAPS